MINLRKIIAQILFPLLIGAGCTNLNQHLEERIEVLQKRGKFYNQMIDTQQGLVKYQSQLIDSYEKSATKLRTRIETLEGSLKGQQPRKPRQRVPYTAKM
jgi:chromosome segregation ATPase